VKRASITPKFVEFIPRELEDGVLYVAFEHLTATHLCCCGCGSKVVMSLRPTDHSLTVVGNGVVSIWPSVGNWDFPCRSDYIIDRNLVVWAAPMRDADIRRAFRADEAMRDSYRAQWRRRNVWWRKAAAAIAGWFRAKR
jgi:hypothetical protein